MIDWIKIEHTTPDKPEVIAIADKLRIDSDAVVGKLIRIWVWADQNSLDGNGIPATESFIDRITHRKGFAKAMRDVGWLEMEEDGRITFGNFNRHNGATAKARAAENRKKASQRERSKKPKELPDDIPRQQGKESAKCPQNVPSATGQSRDKGGGPELELEEEEENKTPHNPPGDLAGNSSDGQKAQEQPPPPSGPLNVFCGSSLVAESAEFLAFIAKFPKKTHKIPAREEWNKALLRGATVAQIMAGIRTSPRVVAASSPEKVVNPAIFLKESCWEDAPAAAAARPSVNPKRFGF